MQQEDDLRGLAKVMEFMRAISIVFVVIHVYWFCYRAFVDAGINIGVVDKILLNFQNTAGLFSNQGRKKSENDMEQDIRGFPIRVGIVLHELVDA